MVLLKSIIILIQVYLMGLSENNIYLLFNNPEMIIHLIKELNNSENIFNKQLNFTF